MARSPGRPRKLDDAKRRRVLSLVLEGATLAKASRAVSCSSRTVQREALRDAEFGWRLRLAQNVRDEAARLGREALRAEWHAAEAARRVWTADERAEGCDKTASPRRDAA